MDGDQWRSQIAGPLVNAESISLRGILPGVHGQTRYNVVRPVSAVSKNKREVVAVVGVAVAKLHLQLCPMHQRPMKTGSRVKDVRVAMLLLASALLRKSF